MIFWRKSTAVTRDADLLADPYYEWARATGFKYYGDADWLPVLIELKKGTAQDFAQHVADTRKTDHDPAGWAAQIRVPQFYETPPARLTKSGSFLAVLVREGLLAAIYAGGPPVEYIRRFVLGYPTPTLGVTPPPPNVPTPPAPIVPPPTVVSGVIDDGIAFAHDRFWDTGRKTRIEYFWDQTVPAASLSGTWGYGRELTEAGINKLMDDSKHLGQVDEDEVYRRAGFVDQTKPGHKPLAARVAHGTHVMDLACTNHLTGASPPAPDSWPIVAVQLPVATVEDTSGATLAPQVFNGLCYVIAKAHAIAPAAPLVVNVSYGMIAGPHDGSSELEKAIDNLIHGSSPAVRVVLPAGNNFLSRCHACLSIGAGQSKTIEWRVLPDDWTENHVEIWLPLGADATQVTFTITTPGGLLSGVVTAAPQDLVSGNAVVGRAEYFSEAAMGKRALVRLSLAPTCSPDDDKPIAPAGLWRIRIDNALAAPLCEVHAWVQRGDSAPGYKRSGRQSYFDDPAYRRYDDGGREIEDDADPLTSASYVKRECTLNAIATGKEPIVIGGFRRSDNKPAPYSAAGPLQYPGYSGRGAPNPDGPEAMFPSEDAPSLRGVLGAGTRSNSCIAMHGTSVSAPQAARFVAAQFRLKAANDRQGVFDAAQMRSPSSPAEQARNGGGKVDMPSTRLPRREP